VQATLSELRRSSSSSTLIFKTITLGSDLSTEGTASSTTSASGIASGISTNGSSAGSDSRVGSIGSVGRKGVAAEKQVEDMTSTFPLQGRWIVQPAGIGNEQVRRAFY